MFVLRPPTPSDLGSLGGVAYATGFFGDSAERYFPDPQLFALLWVWPYLHGGGGAASLLAEDRSGACGYLLGSGPGYGRALAEAAALGLYGTALGRYRPRNWRYPLRLLRSHVPDAGAAYPVHLHLNLLHRARGQGLGNALLEAHLSRLRAAGVPGVQLSATTENRAALGLYRKHGFGVLWQGQRKLWTPWLGRSATHVLMGRRL